MTKTTVYLPDDLKAVVKRLAAERQMSEAEVIRHAIRQLGESTARPRPKVGIFASGDPIAHRVGELLKGFGER